MRWIIHCVFISVMLAAGFAAHSQGTGAFYLYEDSTKNLSAQSALELLAAGKFTATRQVEHNKGFTRSVFWLAYPNDHDRSPDSLLLFIGHNHINRIHFYCKTDSGIVLQWITGDHYPFSQRPVNATNFYFPITKKGIYLARIDKSNESLQLSFRFYTKTEALTQESNDKVVMAIFTGMLFLLAIFGVYLFIIEREKLYLYYILFISTGWLWVLSNSGYGFQYLWPDAPWFASKARPVFSLAPLIFSALFLVRYIGGIKTRRVRIAIRIMNGLLLFCILLVLLVNTESYQHSWWLYVQFLIPLAPLSYVVIIFSVLILSSLQGNRLAMFYLAANIFLLLSALMQVSFSIGSINRFGHFFSQYGLAFGYVMEAVIITAGLAYRFNRYRLDKEKILVEMSRRQRENTRTLMSAQESERNYIANQLHDVAGSLLSAVKLNLSSLRDKGLLGGTASVQLEKTEEAVTLVSEMVRDLSHALSPVMLKQTGFKTAIEKVVSIFNASGRIHIRLIIVGFESYQTAFNNYYTSLYSIVYELLNNIARHSGAKNALLQLMEYEDMFTIVAEDDGVGMDEPGKASQQGLGMSGIESKVNYFNGSIAFDKLAAGGLMVTIEIPISNEELQDNTGG